MSQQQRALEAPIKMRMALGFVPAVPAQSLTDFNEWLAQAATTAEKTRSRFGLAVDARFDAVALRASLDAAALAGQFEGVVSSHELARIDVAIEQARPAR